MGNNKMSNSARPLCAAEVAYGHGHPLVGFGTFFGVTQGIALHLQTQKLSIAPKTWFPNNQARMAGLFLIGGGALIGTLIGKKAFEDPSLLRLHHENKVDQAIAKQ